MLHTEVPGFIGCELKEQQRHVRTVHIICMIGPGKTYLKKLSRKDSLCKFVHMVWRALVARKKAVLSLAVGCADCDSINQKACDLQTSCEIIFLQLL